MTGVDMVDRCRDGHRREDDRIRLARQFTERDLAYGVIAEHVGLSVGELDQTRDVPHDLEIRCCARRLGLSEIDVDKRLVAGVVVH